MRPFVPFLVVTLAVASGTAQTLEKSLAAPGNPTPTGTPTRPLPNPWGVAANGLILYGTTGGDIASVDPASGAVATVLGGAPKDALAGWGTDGTRFVFERTVDGGTALWIADSDGTHARQLLDPAASAGLGWIEGAPDGHRAVMIPADGGDATIFDIDTGATTSVHPPVPIREASWLPDGRMLVVSGAESGAPAVFATIAEDGTGYAVVPTTDAIGHYSLSGDGTRFAYDSWGMDPARQGQIHVVDLASGNDTLLTKPDASFNVLAPVFSPDGRWVMADRLDVVGSKIVLFPADGKGQPVELGPEHAGSDEVSATWAPDASMLIVTFSESGETWLFDLASMSGSKVDWPDMTDHTSWQRVARS